MRPEVIRDILEAAHVLELTPPFTKAYLKKGYRDALMAWHPDRFPDKTELRAKAESRTYQINEAYAMLSCLSENDFPFRDAANAQNFTNSATPPPYADPPETSHQTKPPGQQAASSPQTPRESRKTIWVHICNLLRWLPTPDREASIFIMVITLCGIISVFIPDKPTGREVPPANWPAIRSSLPANWSYSTAYSVTMAMDANPAKWYRMAADQGDAKAQSNLGRCYAYGKGVEQNFVEAAKWARKAADQGDAKAQSNLGWYYVNGKGVEQNFAEAFSWFTQAADRGDAAAKCNLGMCYAYGKAVEQNGVEAYAWFSLAARGGESSAMEQVKIFESAASPWLLREARERANELSRLFQRQLSRPK